MRAFGEGLPTPRILLSVPFFLRKESFFLVTPSLSARDVCAYTMGYRGFHGDSQRFFSFLFVQS